MAQSRGTCRPLGRQPRPPDLNQRDLPDFSSGPTLVLWASPRLDQMSAILLPKPAGLSCASSCEAQDQSALSLQY